MTEGTNGRLKGIAMMQLIAFLLLVQVQPVLSWRGILSQDIQTNRLELQ